MLDLKISRPLLAVTVSFWVPVLIPYTAVWEKCLVNVVVAMFGNDPLVIVGHHQKHHHNKKSSIP
jgi:hypothetical protein